VHGVGGRKEDWAGVAAALAASHRVYTIDMLGFGESSKSGDHLSMHVQADAIRGLLDAEEVHCATIIGNSVGGWVAATFAATFPERTARLILIDAAGFRAMFEGAPPVNFDPGTAEELQMLINFVINASFADTPGLAQRAFAAYVASGEKAIAGTWGRASSLRPVSKRC
jgi:pimeloyl-ACP methyl ester carboxylesterase